MYVCVFFIGIYSRAEVLVPKINKQLGKAKRKISKQPMYKYKYKYKARHRHRKENKFISPMSVCLSVCLYFILMSFFLSLSLYCDKLLSNIYIFSSSTSNRV